MARRKTTNGSGAKKVDGLKGVRLDLGNLRRDVQVEFGRVRLDLGKLRHDTNVRFLATERVIASGFAELSERIVDVGDRIDRVGENGVRLLEAFKENAVYTRQNTALLTQMVEHGKVTANLEPRVSRCEFEIDELKKKT